jgi:hypothetical protein
MMRLKTKLKSVLLLEDKLRKRLERSNYDVLSNNSCGKLILSHESTHNNSPTEEQRNYDRTRKNRRRLDQEYREKEIVKATTSYSTKKHDKIFRKTENERIKQQMVSR